MGKEIVKLLKEYSYYNLVIKKMPIRHRINRLFILLYILSFIPFVLTVFIFYPFSLNTRLFLLVVCGIYLIDLKLKNGIFNRLYTRSLKYEMQFIGVKSEKELYRKSNKLQLKKVSKKLSKEYNHMSRQEIIDEIKDYQSEKPKIRKLLNSISSVIGIMISPFYFHWGFNNLDFSYFLKVTIILVIYYMVIVTMFKFLLTFNENKKQCDKMIEIVRKTF